MLFLFKEIYLHTDIPRKLFRFIHLYVSLAKHLLKMDLYSVFLLKVSYIPAEVYTTPGSEVTVYSVFHNRSWSASKAAWFLNGKMKIPESQYRVINEQVSTVTLKMDKAGFDTLMCCHTLGEKVMCTIPYAKIYTEGDLRIIKES